jgi:NADH dehydrogenase
LVWSAGVMAKPIKGISEIAATHGGRIRVDRCNKVRGLNNIYAIGDINFQQEGDYQNGHPQVAQVGLQQATVLGDNLINILKGKEMKSFHYKDRGSLATIGKNLAVADLPGIKTQGFLAWILWLFVHLMAIVGVKNRFFILVNWVWNYWTSDQSLRVLIRPDKRSFTDRASKKNQKKDGICMN